METISRQQLKAKLDANQDVKLVMTVGGSEPVNPCETGQAGNC
jgi:hypothetical protein